MNLYSGEQHGIERAAMNNKISVAVDMQPLFETTFADITSTSPTVFPTIYDFNGDVLTLDESNFKLITVMQKTDVYLYQRDQIGSIRAVTTLGEDDIPVVVWSGDYKPFGELLTNDLDTDWIPLKTFALHEHDKETNLIYAQQRWLDYETGQFISEDPIMDGLNWYAYTGGNPMGNVDPMGLDYGFMVKSLAVYGAGHTAHWVGNDNDGYYFFESRPYDATKGNYFDNVARFQNDTSKWSGFVTAPFKANLTGIAELNVPTGVFAQYFTDRMSLESFLIGYRGENKIKAAFNENPNVTFDRRATFTTTPKQDRQIIEHSLDAQNWFSYYELFTFACDEFSTLSAREGGIYFPGGVMPNQTFDAISSVKEHYDVKISDANQNWRRDVTLTFNVISFILGPASYAVQGITELANMIQINEEKNSSNFDWHLNYEENSKKGFKNTDSSMNQSNNTSSGLSSSSNGNSWFGGSSTYSDGSSGYGSGWSVHSDGETYTDHSTGDSRTR